MLIFFTNYCNLHNLVLMIGGGGTDLSFIVLSLKNRIPVHMLAAGVMSFKQNMRVGGGGGDFTICNTLDFLNVYRLVSI